MTADSRDTPGRRDGVGPPASPGSGTRPGRGSEPERLPPPAFPPGSRRLALRVSARPGAGEGEAEPPGLPADAFIRPDEPIVRGARDEAFISPDEPLPPRTRRPAPAAAHDLGEVRVTGIGDDAHLDDEELAAPGWDDPDLARLVDRVGRLAEALRERGEAGLRTAPGMSRFEATLRAYCVGWLAARREGQDEA